MKVLIVDDEYGIRLILKKTIEKFKGFQVVGEAEEGEKAILLFEKLQPEIVFLDVEMSGISGIECARKIFDINPKTIIIFATAHNEYMPEAFEMYAFDYMIKPFKVERIYQTLNRIKELEEKGKEHIIKNVIRNEKGLDKLFIKNKEGISVVDISEVIMIQREDRSTVVITTEEEYITSEGLSELEGKLDKTQFFRSHKSYIVNLAMIYKIYPYGRWTYIIKLKNTNKDALLTHDKYEELKKLFNI
jgi:two-component system, LytTR family, response regulator